MAKILITGASGTIGIALCKSLENSTHEVVALSRSSNPITGSKIPVYQWDIAKGYIDTKALQGVDYIIHLAGANVADKAWSKKRKKAIIDSRVASTELLYRYVKEMNIALKKFISASAIGYYGAVISTHTFHEDTPKGNDFLAQVCSQWEAAAESFQTLGTAVCILRTGVVLSADGGALPRLASLTKRGLGAPIASGRQYMPWIHIQDMVAIYRFAIEQPIEGIYNATASEQPRNKVFMRTLATVLRRPMLMPKVPTWLLRLMMGQRSQIISQGSRVKNDKIKAAGFSFSYDTLEAALRHLLKK